MKTLYKILCKTLAVLMRLNLVLYPVSKQSHNLRQRYWRLEEEYFREQSRLMREKINRTIGYILPPRGHRAE